MEQRNGPFENACLNINVHAFIDLVNNMVDRVNGVAYTNFNFAGLQERVPVDLELVGLCC
jgi:hypothetical protein